MTITVDQEVCVGCGLCTSLAEEVFEMKDGKSQVIEGVDLESDKNKRAAKEAADSCPVQAIKIED